MALGRMALATPESGMRTVTSTVPSDRYSFFTICAPFTMPETAVLITSLSTAKSLTVVCESI